MHTIRVQSPSARENSGSRIPTVGSASSNSGETASPEGLTTMTGTQGDRPAARTGPRSQWIRGAPASTMSPSSTRGAKPRPRRPTVSIPR
nr:MAG TPA: hypothetical protein [Caudoviricetes sp.]